MALAVRDHALISAFSAISVSFVLLFAAVITLMAILPGGAAAWRRGGRCRTSFPGPGY